jgi:hypothetical protein
LTRFPLERACLGEGKPSILRASGDSARRGFGAEAPTLESGLASRDLRRAGAGPAGSTSSARALSSGIEH